MVARGKFIAIEGIDGSGITTHGTLLKKWLATKKFRVHLSAEPTDSPIGSLIRQILKGYWDVPKRPDLLGLLYAADRIYHVNYETYGHGSAGGIENALQEGYMVIFNRYLFSSLAYQSVPSGGIERGIDWLKKINTLGMSSGIPIPDLTIFIDVPPEESMKRLTFERDRYELFESYNNLRSVYENFQKILSESIYNITTVKGTKNGRPRPIEDVQEEIQQHVLNLSYTPTKNKQKRGRPRKSVGQATMTSQ